MPALPAPQGSISQVTAADGGILDIETICMDDVQIIPTDVINSNLADLGDFSDVIVVPPATTADVLPPITSDLFTYAFQNSNGQLVSEANLYAPNSPIATTVSSDDPGELRIPPLSALPTVSNAPHHRTSMAQPVSTFTSVSGAFPVSAASTASSPTVVSLPEKTSDDAVFLTPLPIISYAKPPSRTAKNYQRPKPRPSNPNQNQLIKALLAHNTLPIPYVARATAPKPATQSFIIRASTQHQGKTQYLNLPITASTPVSIIRNTTQGGPTRPTITHSLLVKEMHRPTLNANRSAFVRTASGMDFIAHGLVATTAHALKTETSSITMMTPLTILPQAIYTTTAASGHIATTLTNVSTLKPLGSTSSSKARANLSAYTKAFIPIPRVPVRGFPKTDAQTKSEPISGTVTKNQSPNRVLATKTKLTAAPATLTLNTTRASIASANVTSHAAKSHSCARTNTGAYKSRYLEPGEIPQGRKFPPRTCPGTRNVQQRQVTTQAVTRAQLKAAAHAQHHAEAQVQQKASAHIHHHAASLAVLQATSLAQLQAASHAQLQAASQAQQKAAQAIIHAESQCHQSSRSQHQHAPPAKAQSKTHLLAEALSQPVTFPRPYAQSATAERPHTVSLTQTKTNAHGLVQTVHHRLILRSANPSVSLAEQLQQAASHPPVSAVALPITQSSSESLPNTSLQGDSFSPVHTTSTLTLSTGTTLIMPHYKTTVFKNLSTIASAETNAAKPAAPVTTAATGSTERVVIRRPVAYFSARRTFPTQPSGQTTSTTVNVQRHIIRTIPRHVLGTHLQDPSRASAPANSHGISTLQIVSTSSSELSSSPSSIKNKPQSVNKKK